MKKNILKCITTIMLALTLCTTITPFPQNRTGFNSYVSKNRLTFMNSVCYLWSSSQYPMLSVIFELNLLNSILP